MFLKKITLHGFKSFADRTEFEFGAGITAVVGPNGCGKSNILDALRWVLGEQSAKHLRGSRMSDVVFNGSRARKPATHAEVEITFNNASRILSLDQEEVTVGRVLYSSGDSEYRLNGNSCRLKDIRDLLLDTGVGVDAYSIIEQGRVDAMLQANPLERREIFEEAAGISRYKVRRAEAQRKLERTQQNLLRLNDVVDELEKRLRSVKVAAGKARNFQQYDARLRELRAAFSLAEFHDLETQRIARQTAADGHVELLAAKRAELSQQDAHAAELDHELQGVDEHIQDFEQALQSLLHEVSTLTERGAQIERRIDELGALREQRLGLVEELASRAAQLTERIAAEERLVRDLLAEEQRAGARVEEARAVRHAADEQRQAARAAMDQLRSAAYESARRSSLLNNEIANLEQNSRRLTAQRDQLLTRQSQRFEEKSVLAQRRQSAVMRAEQLDATAVQRAAELRDNDRELTETRAALDTVRQQVVADKEIRSGLVSRLQLLEQMERNLEGVDEGARHVLRWGPDESAAGVLGIVADLLQIDDPRVSCLRGILAKLENRIVIRATHNFLGALARRGEPPGPVHVCALDRIPSQVSTQDFAGAPGVIARAADWVHCTDELRPLTEQLLGRVIIVDEFERALALASTAPAGFVFVTLDGRVADQAGGMLLGKHAGGGGLISRKAEIRQLRLDLEEVESRLDLASRRAAELDRNRADVELRRESLLSDIATTQRQHAEANADVARADDEIRRTERDLVYIADELALAATSLDELSARAQRLADEQSNLAAQQQSHETELKAAADLLAEREAQASQAGQALTDAMVEMGRVTERRNACAAAVAALQHQGHSLQQQQQRAAREAQDAVTQISTARDALGQTRERCAALAQDRDQRQDEILRVRQARQELRQKIEACGAATKELHNDIEEADALLHEAQASLREIAVRKETLTSRVHDELSLRLDEMYAAYEHAEQDWTAIKDEIEELRGKIQRLGNVNLDSITELEELSPRYENLVTQRQDLLDSIQRLTALIEELDNESRARFATTFETIRAHFQEFFRKLFGGGKADVILENPDSPLDAGIEIIARPPGKEPQSISLLSGGEKTMTAVALLLAVFRSKPSPFTVLDEVDAALDEANVGRFNSVLREFLDQTQFVVITHHKRTMQSSDVLYGITMEEPGVSKRVAVKFEEQVVTSV